MPAGSFGEIEAGGTGACLHPVIVEVEALPVSVRGPGERPGNERRGRVSALPQDFGQGKDFGLEAPIHACHRVERGGLRRKQGNVRGERPGGRRDRGSKQDSLTGECVDRRGGLSLVTVTMEMIAPERVDRDEKDVRGRDLPMGYSELTDQCCDCQGE